MKKQKIVCAIVSVAVLCAVTMVTATYQASGTPLYTVRMEQVSSKMNFLPIAVNDIMYTAKEGYALNSNSSGWYGGTSGDTCPATCETCYNTCGKTCPLTCDTCYDTCPLTGCTPCGDTQPDTCPLTCDTCYDTC